jgi:hypothetical protein
LLLLVWRGCEAAPEPSPEDEAGAAAPPAGDEPWEAGDLPAPRPLRPLPVGAVLKSLGPSGIRVGVGDLSDALARAYASFARR